MKKIFIKLILKVITIINKIMYPKYDVNNSPIHQIIIFIFGFQQKILGFNRHVPWPVHRSSTVKECSKIYPGTRAPGFSKNCHIDGRNGIVCTHSSTDFNLLKMRGRQNNLMHIITFIVLKLARKNCVFIVVSYNMDHQHNQP